MKDKYFRENNDKYVDIILSNDFNLEEMTKRMDKELYSGVFKWAFSCADLSERDLSMIPVEKMMRLPFGNYTIWPTSDKMPKGFEPKKILNEALFFKGNDVEWLHKQNITGEGITIAYIDMPFNSEHVELEGANIEFVEFSYDHPSHFHGLVVTSYLVGKNLGIAPRSKLIFYGASCYDQDQNTIESMIKNELEALVDTIRRSKNGEKIDIIGQSGSIKYHISFLEDVKKKRIYLERYEYLLKELKKEKIFYLSSENFFDMFSYCRKEDPTKPNNDYDNYINSFSKNKSNDLQKPCVIPVGKLSPIDDTKDAYKYENCSGSASWSIPLVVGMFALCRQLKSDISFEEFYKIVKETAKTNKNGVPLISMERIYDKLTLDR